AGLQTAAIKAQQKTIKAKAAGTESGVAGIWDDAEVPKWKVGGLMRAYSNIGDKVGLVNRERKAVLGGVNMGDMRAATGNNSRNFVKAFGGDEPPEGSAPWKTIAYRRRVGATVNAVMDAKAERKLKDEGSSTKTLKGRLRLRELKRQERVDLIAQYGGLEDPSKAGQEYWAHGVSYAALEAANKEMQGTVVGKGDLAAYRELGDKDYTPEGGKKGGGGESGGGGRKLAAKILTPAGTSKRRQTPEGGKLG
ncbi:hypothetical protein KJ596_01460, partial [Patescibacteria group bacterium]|nr:hypothetical protein [Patescibacteria group bacterium]